MSTSASSVSRLWLLLFFACTMMPLSLWAGTPAAAPASAAPAKASPTVGNEWLTVQGTLVDAQNQRPLAYGAVEVRVGDTLVAQPMADENGRFVARFHSGTFAGKELTLQARSVGYERVEIILKQPFAENLVIHMLPVMNGDGKGIIGIVDASRIRSQAPVKPRPARKLPGSPIIQPNS